MAEAWSSERCCVQYNKPTTYLSGGGIFETKCMQNMARCWLVGEKHVIRALQEPNTGFSWEAVILFSQTSGFLA